MLTKMKIIAITSAITMATVAAPAVAAPYVTTDKAAFDSIRNVTNYTFPTPSTKIQTTYTQNGVTFLNSSEAVIRDNGFSGSDYLSASYSDFAAGSASPLTVTFAGTVLGLTLGSYYGAQTVNYSVLNGPSGTINLLAGQATSFFGIDTGGPSGISVTFKPSKELDVIGFQTAVPEPATWAMMIVGLGAVGVSMRRAARRSEQRFNARIKRIEAGALA